MPTLHGRFDLFAPISDEPCELCGEAGALATYRPVVGGVSDATQDKGGRPVRLHALCAALFIDRYGRQLDLADSGQIPELPDPQS